jgi:hypothetical protein
MCKCSTYYNIGRYLTAAGLQGRSVMRLLFVTLQQHPPGLAMVFSCLLARQSHGCHLETARALPKCHAACACHSFGRQICRLHVASPRPGLRFAVAAYTVQGLPIWLPVLSKPVPLLPLSHHRVAPQWNMIAPGTGRRRHCTNITKGWGGAQAHCQRPQRLRQDPPTKIDEHTLSDR